MDAVHTPVLLDEAIEYLAVQTDQWYVDATFGRGGHTQAILDSGGKVLGMDCDEQAIGYGLRRFVRAIEDKRLRLVRENFELISDVLQKEDRSVREHLHGILADFGVSSPQLEIGERGFSFEHDAPLDMRMDQRLSVTAKDLVNGLGRGELVELLIRYGGEHHARVIADTITSYRKRKPIETTTELAGMIEHAVRRQGRLHPATKTFQALRIAINDELGSIDRFLPRAFDRLLPQGRLVTISFHEGEDRLVKHFSQHIEQEEKGRALTKKPVEPTEVEINRNPRSRSAKLRAIEKL